MAYFVYVLMSQTHGTRYVGSTEDIKKRIKDHNAGRVRYTKGRRPWKLVYFEERKNQFDAKRRENFLKTGNGRSALNNLLKNSNAGVAELAYAQD